MPRLNVQGELRRRLSDAMPFTGGFARIEEETMRDETDLRDAGGHWFASYTIHTYIPEGNEND